MLAHALSFATQRVRVSLPLAAMCVAAFVTFAASSAHAEEPGLALGEVRAGSFIGFDGTKLELDPIYKAHFKKGDPQHLRNLAWQAGILGIGVTWYWLNATANSTDWEFDSGNFAERFTLDAIRFDNNSFNINHLAHPTAGGGYYLAARVHNYGVGMSSLISFGSSLVWEAGLEWRERISINDMIFTPGAGIAMGEAYYRLSHYLNSAPDGGTWAHKALAWAIGWPVAVNRWIDGIEPVGDGVEDDLGFSGAYTHRFRIAAQSAQEEGDFRGDAGFLSGFRLEFDINAVPGFQRPGTLAMMFYDGNFTSFDGSFFWSADGIAIADLLFESVVVGYYQQDYKGPVEAVSGSAGRVAMAFAFENYQRYLPEPQDRRALLHLPGLQIKVWYALSGWIFDTELALNPDFASIESIAFPYWKAQNPRESERSILELQGYYLGWGATTRLESTLRKGGFSLKGRLRLSYVSGIEGMDRLREEVTEQSNLEDTIIESYVALGYTHRPSLVSARAEMRRFDRAGRLGGEVRDRQWTHISGSLGIEF